MIKAFALFRKSPSAGHYAFRNFICDEFPRLVLGTERGQSIWRIIANHVTERDIRPTGNFGNHVWSAVLEYYFEDETAAVDAISDPSFIAVGTSVPHLVEEQSFTIAEELVIYDKGLEDNSVKVMGFIKNSLPEGNPMTRQEMSQRWMEHSLRMLDEGFDKRILKFSQNRTLPSFHSSNRRFDYDGAAVTWFESVEIAESIFKSEEVDKRTAASSEKMGSRAGDSVYLRTTPKEVYVRSSVVAC